MYRNELLIDLNINYFCSKAYFKSSLLYIRRHKGRLLQSSRIPPLWPTRSLAPQLPLGSPEFLLKDLRKSGFSETVLIRYLQKDYSIFWSSLGYTAGVQFVSRHNQKEASIELSFATLLSSLSYRSSPWGSISNNSYQNPQAGACSTNAELTRNSPNFFENFHIISLEINRSSAGLPGEVPAIDPAQAGISIAWSCYFAKTTPLVFVGVSHPRLSDGRSESLA